MSSRLTERSSECNRAQSQATFKVQVISGRHYFQGSPLSLQIISFATFEGVAIFASLLAKPSKIIPAFGE